MRIEPTMNTVAKNDIPDEFRELQKWLSNDNSQYLFIGMQSIIELFKIIMASLLTITVIQTCDESAGNICSFNNALRRDVFSNIGFIINCINIVAFIFFYIIEVSRELYIIKMLDIDKHRGDFHLQQIIPMYPSIQQNLMIYNHWYQHSIRVLYVITCGNWIVSIIIIGTHWYSIKTIMTLLTNILLITTKLSNIYTISNESNTKNIAISAYIKEYASFNVIDKDHMIPHV
jgi:hypothetical protein